MVDKWGISFDNFVALALEQFIKNVPIMSLSALTRNHQLIIIGCWDC